MPDLHVVPSPAATLSAEQLVARVRERGGRVYRMRRERVFALTTDPELAAWLVGLGAKANSNGDPTLGDGSYYRSRVERQREWDLWIHPIETVGDVWEAAGASS